MRTNVRIRRLSRILRTVSKFYGVSTEDIKRNDRREHVKSARYMFWYICNELGYTLNEMALFIDKDRNTARHGIEMVKDSIDITQKLTYDKMIWLDTEYLSGKCYKYRKIRRTK